ncbi:MAG: AMP-binding protein, partial [Myxococcota bacterium]
MPFDLLVESLAPDRETSRTPIVQAMFAFNEQATAPTLPGLDVAPLDVDLDISKFDMTLGVTRRANEFVCSFEYDTDVFAAETIDSVATTYVRLLRAFLEDVSRPIEDVEVLGDADYARLVTWRHEPPGLAKDACIHELVRAAVERCPDAIAVRCGEASLTYRALSQRSCQLADTLRARGVRPGITVGVCVERSVDLVVAVLAVLEAGGAYVPMDPRYPLERLSFMRSDAGVAVIVGDAALPSGLASDVEIVRVDRSAAVAEPYRFASLPAKPLDVAYIIYTSGSTGQPKGVEISHRNAVAMLTWATEQAFDQGELAVVLASTSICFDLSVFELFATLTAGGTVVVAESALDVDAWRDA